MILNATDIMIVLLIVLLAFGPKIWKDMRSRF